MGLFDFGDKAMIKTKAMRVNIGLMQLANELDKNNGTKSPAVVALSSALKKELKEIIDLSNKLSDSAKASIAIDMQGKSVSFPAFLFTIKFISDDLYNSTGLKLLE